MRGGQHLSTVFHTERNLYTSTFLSPLTLLTSIALNSADFRTLGDTSANPLNFADFCTSGEISTCVYFDMVYFDI